MSYNLNNHELDNDIFKFPEVASNDFLKVDSFAAASRTSNTYKFIKSIVEYRASFYTDLGIDEANFRVRKIEYHKPNGNIVVLYAVSGVYSKSFSKYYKTDFRDFILNMDGVYSILHKLPKYADATAEESAIVFTDIIDQLIAQPRSFVDYKTCKLINGGYPKDDNGTEFVKDNIYFHYWNSIVSLYDLLYDQNHFSDSSIFIKCIIDIFFISNILDDDEVNNKGITLAKNITEDQVKGILLSNILNMEFTNINLNAYKYKIKDENYTYNDFINSLFKVINEENIKKYKERLDNLNLKVIKLLSSSSFKESLPLEKLSRIYEFGKSNPYMNSRFMYL